MPQPQTEPAPEAVTRELTVDAPIEEVWEAVATDAGRERWLEPDPDRRVVVERTAPPGHITWWWWQESDAEPARQVEIRLVAIPHGTRITVTETRPALVPIAQFGAIETLLVCV